MQLWSCVIIILYDTYMYIIFIMQLFYTCAGMYTADEGDQLDGSKLLEPDYCEWVIQVWRYGATVAAEEST